MVMLNDLDRFHLVIDVIDRVPGLAVAPRRAAPADGRRAAALPAVHARARGGRPGRGRLGVARVAGQAEQGDSLGVCPTPGVRRSCTTGGFLDPTPAGPSYGGVHQLEHRRKGQPCLPPITLDHPHHPHRICPRATDLPLARLVDAARAGCPGAWRAVVDRFDDGLHAIGRGYGLDAATVDDAVQQTWLSAFTHLAALREPAALSGWLRSILHRECIKAANRSNPRGPGRRAAPRRSRRGRPRHSPRRRTRAGHRRTRRSVTPTSQSCATRCAAGSPRGSRG